MMSNTQIDEAQQFLKQNPAQLRQIFGQLELAAEEFLRARILAGLVAQLKVAASVVRFRPWPYPLLPLCVAEPVNITDLA